MIATDNNIAVTRGQKRKLAVSEESELSAGSSLPIVMCVGMVEYSEQEFNLKRTKDRNPERLARFRDTLRLRALRKKYVGVYEVISIADIDLARSEPHKFRSSCFDLKYRKGMSLNIIRTSGFIGPISMVLFDFSNRMPVGYFADSFPSVTCIFDSPGEIADDCVIIFKVNSDTKAMVDGMKQLAGANTICEIAAHDNPLYEATSSVTELADYFDIFYHANEGFFEVERQHT